MKVAAGALAAFPCNTALLHPPNSIYFSAISNESAHNMSRDKGLSAIVGRGLMQRRQGDDAKAWSIPVPSGWRDEVGSPHHVGLLGNKMALLGMAKKHTPLSQHVPAHGECQ